MKKKNILFSVLLPMCNSTSTKRRGDDIKINNNSYLQIDCTASKDLNQLTTMALDTHFPKCLRHKSQGAVGAIC